MLLIFLSLKELLQQPCTVQKDEMGVIIITSKTAEKGKAVIELDQSIAVNQLARLPENNSKIFLLQANDKGLLLERKDPLNWTEVRFSLERLG